MKRLFVSTFCTVGMLAVSALCSISCDKDKPVDPVDPVGPDKPVEVVVNPGEEVLTIPELLKYYDLAAIVDWTYALDAETDHALYTHTDAQYSRSDLPLSLGSKSENKVSGTVSVTVTSAYNRVTNKAETPSGLTMNVSSPSDGKAVASVQGLKWGMNYYFTVKAGDNSFKGIIATVDRNRDVIEIDLPEWAVKLNDTAAGYNKSKDTYTGKKQSYAEALFNSFAANKIINADPAHPDYADADAFLAMEGKMEAAAQEGDTDQITFSKGSATPKITPSSKLKEALENGGRLVRHMATYCGQLVKFVLPVSVSDPGYDFLHLCYYTFNTKFGKDGFVTDMKFDGNDGSVEWWTSVYPSYFITLEGGMERISNRYAMAQYDVSRLNLAELAFNVVDGQDNILGDLDIEAANLSVRFDYADPEQGSKSLPEIDVTSKYKTYKDLWVNPTVFYYRTCEKEFIPVRGIISVRSGDADFELPTRFDRPKASVKHPDVMLDYSSFAVVGWQPFKVPAHPDFEIALSNHITYRTPMLKELKDNRPNGVSFYVVNNGAWEVGNVQPADAENGRPEGGNGYIKGIAAYDAYGLDSSTALQFEWSGENLPAELKDKVSVQFYKSFPHIIIDYKGDYTLKGNVDIPVTCTLRSPWDEIRFTYTITIKGS